MRHAAELAQIKETKTTAEQGSNEKPVAHTAFKS
jgi:hypothetical protein